MSYRLFVSWEWFCEWLGYAPDKRVYSVRDDVQ